MNEDLKRWDEEAENWDREIQSKQRIGKLILDAEFEKLLGDIKGQRILDAGCGNGRFTKILSDLGGDIIGIDGSRKMIELAKKNFPELKFESADLLNKLEFNNESFDQIVCANVLMSLKTLNRFLEESYRVLKTHGTVIISVLHPAFNEPTMKLYRPLWAKILGRPVMGLAQNYFQTTERRQDAYGTKPWPFYHRTLETYVDEFRKHNFLIDRITEPDDVPASVLNQDPEHYASRLPRFLFFKLVKQ